MLSTRTKKLPLGWNGSWKNEGTQIDFEIHKLSSVNKPMADANEQKGNMLCCYVYLDQNFESFRNNLWTECVGK